MAVGVLLAVQPPTIARAATTVHTGTLDGETHPFDDYPVNLVVGDVLTVDMVCDTSTPLDPALQLFGPSMSLILSDDDGGTVVCAQSRSSRFTYTATVAGRYTIRASSYEIVFDNDPIDPNADGAYTLTIDAPAHSGGFTATGTLDGETNPFDDFPVQLLAGEAMTVDMVCDTSTPLDPALQLLGPSMSVILSDDDGGTVACAQSRSSRFTYTATVSGIYTIRASSYEIVFDNDPTDPNADGGYTLTATGGFLATPAFTSAAALTVPVGTALSHTFTATGLPAPTFAYSNEHLPPGVTRTGDVLSGTPTLLGTYGTDAIAGNGRSPDAVQAFTITVTGTPAAITSASSVSAVADVPLTFTVTATGVPAPTISYANEVLPPGVIRSGDVLSGTPTTPGVYGLDVTADNGISASAHLTIEITAPPQPSTSSSTSSSSVPASEPTTPDSSVSTSSVVNGSTSDPATSGPTTTGATATSTGDSASTTSLGAAVDPSVAATASTASGVSSASPVPSATGVLPATGIDESTLVVAAAVVLGTGLVATTIRRRSRPPHLPAPAPFGSRDAG